MVQLTRIRHKRFAVVQPWPHIAGGHWGPCIAPAVAIKVTVARHNNRLAGGVRDADKGLRAVFLPVFVKAHRRFDLRVFTMYGLARYVTVQSVKGLARDFAAVLHVKIGLVVLNVGKALIPLRLLYAAQFFALDLGDHGRRVVGEHVAGF